MADGLPPQIAPQVAILERAADLDHPDHQEVESLARAADLDLVVHHQMVGTETDTKVNTKHQAPQLPDHSQEHRLPSL